MYASAIEDTNQVMVHVKKSFFINIALIIVAAAVSYSAAHMVQNALNVRVQSADMTQSIEQLKVKKQELEVLLTELQTKEAVEREAKERLNLKKPGEQVVVVVPEKKDSSPAKQPMSLWEKFMSFFNVKRSK